MKQRIKKNWPLVKENFPYIIVGSLMCASVATIMLFGIVAAVKHG